jgi:hypothetical protein
MPRLVNCPDDSDSDFGKIYLEGPGTLAGATSRFSAPSVWRVLFRPLDFGVSNTQKVDSWEHARERRDSRRDPEFAFEIAGTRH